MTEFSSMNRAPHTLHECRDAADLSRRFEATTGSTLQEVVGALISSEVPRAIFVVGSFPLGMASSGSDLDLIVLVDSRAALQGGEQRIANTAQQLQFSSESESLVAGIFLQMVRTILVDIQVTITPAVHDVYARLRIRGTELSETEIRTLSRISSGWLLWETEGYMEQHRTLLTDPALTVYCCTKNFVSALHEIAKASRALACQDLPLALQLARTAVEKAYLAYFATEGLAYLGSKWLAQLGHAQGAPDRVRRYPILQQGIDLLFPQYTTESVRTTEYLQSVRQFLTSMRGLMEQKMLFRIALQACPQAQPL